MARPTKCRCICQMPRYTRFGPQDASQTQSAEDVILGVDEFEVIRLLDYEHLTQEQCAQRMHIARTTVTRMYEQARTKLAQSLVTGRQMRIEGGEYVLCERMRPECADRPHCCHRIKAREEGR